MKKSNVLFFLLLLSNVLFAQTVSVNDAMTKAQALRTSSHRKALSSKKVSSGGLELAYTSSKDGKTLFYVFNYQDGGFAIIGGDEVAKEVLGYCETGTFDIDSIPDGLKYMLGYYGEEISAAAQNGATSSAESINEVSASKTSLSPLVSTKWGQGSPYNSEIPLLDTGFSSFLTGCGATAVAQILKYWNYPVRGTGNKSYTITYTAYSKSCTFSADFENTTYDWGNMLDSYSGGYTSDQAKAVGTLMYHASVALNTSYGWSGSSSYTSYLRPAFVNYFGYDANATMTYRDSYSDTDWENLIYNEIKAGRPLLYRGQSTSGGHAFICDGYDASSGNYHFNWGWEGYCDGYFPLTGTGAIQPTSGGGYTGSQSAIIGLQPATMAIPVTGISLSKKTLSLTAGKTKQLTATITPSDASNQNVIWSSNNTNVATVSSTGLITALSAGTATITCLAADGSKVNATCSVTVTPNLASRKNAVKSNTAAATYSFTTDGTYEWDWDATNSRIRSSNSGVPSSTSQTTMTIESTKSTEFSFDYGVSSEAGFDKLTILLDGTTIVDAVSGVSSGSHNSILSLGSHTLLFKYVKDSSVDSNDDRAYLSNIKFVTIPATSVSLNTTSATLYVGKTKTLKATVAPETVSDASVTWSSSDINVATVSTKGVVTAKAKGTAVITATTSNGKTATCKITVKPVITQPVTKIVLSDKSSTMWVGATKTLTATVSPEDASDNSVTWTSSDTSVAAISSSGEITAVGAGTCTITCAAVDGSGVKTTCAITVKKQVTDITLSATTATMWVGKTSTLKATVNADATKKTVTWKSSKTSVATVSTSGKITAVGRGTCIITCTAADGYGTTAVCSVTVKQQVTSLDLGSEALTLTSGTVQTLTPTLAPTNASVKTVTWKSTDTSVATITSKGVLTAVNPGTTNIICTSKDGFKAADTCAVTVTALTITDSNPDIAEATYGVGGLVYKRSIKSGKYAAFCLPYAVDLNDYTDKFSKVYVPMNVAVYKSDGSVMISVKKLSLAETIPAGHPFIVLAAKSCSLLLANSSSAKISSLEEPGATSLDVYDYGTNFLTYNTDVKVQVRGNYAKVTGLDSSDNFAFSTAGAMSSVTSVSPYRLYVAKDDALASAKVTDVQFIFDDDEATGIENILRNGQSGDEKVYNLKGQRVNSSDAQRGIYIINGKKVIRK